MRWKDLNERERGIDVWRAHTPQERLAAMEQLREPLVRAANAGEGFPRICRFVERARR